MASKQSKVPFLDFLPNAARNHFIAMAGEFAGTFLFLFFAFTGTQVANSQTQSATSTTIAQGSNPAQLLYISLCFGFSLAVNAWVFFRISGGLFNPAVRPSVLHHTQDYADSLQVSVGMILVGAVPWFRGCLVMVSQLLGGIAASAVVSALYPGKLNVRTALNAGTSRTQGLFIEMFLTAELVFTIFMLAAEKHKGTFIAPVGIGLSLFIAELGGVYYTGGSLNPARSFGPCVVAHQFEDYHWIYWIGPLLGSLLASGFYKFIKMLEYETANPGQDFDENETQLFDPERDTNRPMVNFSAPSESSSQPITKSRPISGDTFAEYQREEVPLEQLRSQNTRSEQDKGVQDRPGSGPMRQQPQAQAPMSAMKGSRRRGSSLPSLDPEMVMSDPEPAKAAHAHETRNQFDRAEDLVHGGPHYSQTANRLDPNVQTDVPSLNSYQSGPATEAGRP
ncbi:MAG: hypothetical protein Q9207_006033 [Kuettlingeria erythrocarpa]